MQSVLTLSGYSIILSKFNAWVVLVFSWRRCRRRSPRCCTRVRDFRMQLALSRAPRKLNTSVRALQQRARQEIASSGLGLVSSSVATKEPRGESSTARDTRLMVRTGVTYALSLLATLSFYGAYAMMAVSAAAGAITLGNMTMASSRSATDRPRSSPLSGIGSIYEHNLYMSTCSRTSTRTSGPTPAVSEGGARGASSHRSGIGE